MRKQCAMALLLAGTLFSTNSFADENPSPVIPNASVYFGPCVSLALNGPKGKDEKTESAVLSAALAAAIPSLIGAGVDWLGQRLSTLGEDEKTTLYGTRATDGDFNTRSCIQIARPSKDGQRLVDLLNTQPGWSETAKALEINENYDPSNMPKNLQVDFFMEFWARHSSNSRVVSLTPTLLYYPTQLTSKKNGKNDAAIVVSAKITPAGQASASWTWALKRQTPNSALQVVIPVREDGRRIAQQRDDDLKSLCEKSCDDASPWTGTPWVSLPEQKAKANNGETTKTDGNTGNTPTPLASPVGKPGDTSNKTSPLAANITMEITEIRAGSAFFKAVGEAFTAAKPALKTGLETAILPDKRAEAEASAATTKAAALTAFATKLGEADSYLKDSYCAAKGKPGTNWKMLSANLLAKQLVANVAAEAAELPRPFDPPVAVADKMISTLCP